MMARASGGPDPHGPGCGYPAAGGILGTMRWTMRKRGWHPLVSLLLMAMLVPVQAAGCCRLSAVLGFLLETGIRSTEAPLPSATSAAGAENPASGGAASDGNGASILGAQSSHACCPRKAPASAQPSDSWNADEARAGGPSCAGDQDGSPGCCLEGYTHADPGFVSADPGPAFRFADRLRNTLDPVPAAPSLPALALPADSGPPVYLAFRRLLI